ncbi:MAG: hypothetical protein ACPG52_01675 [Cognaticolwellia sp.]
MSKPIPSQFFDLLPTPILIGEFAKESLNHKVAYVNKAFVDTLGWSLCDIPDKDHWWQKAYPDPSYQKTVASLWELNMESAIANMEDIVTLTVNIMTKYQGVKRFNVHTELKSTLLDGYYVVQFEEMID